MTRDCTGCCVSGRHCQGKAPRGGMLERVWKYVTVSFVLSRKGVRDGLAIAEARSGKQRSTSERVGRRDAKHSQCSPALHSLWSLLGVIIRPFTLLLEQLPRPSPSHCVTLLQVLGYSLKNKHPARCVSRMRVI